MSRIRPGHALEGLLTSVSHGNIVVNHHWWTVNFCLLAFSIFGTVSFTTVFFVTHCLVLADELQSLFYMIVDRLDSGRIWDVVQVCCLKMPYLMKSLIILKLKNY